MFKKLSERREALTAKYLNAKGSFQKGFTLMEMLFVIIIVLILIGCMIVAFNFFGRVDGTELSAQSKNVESGVLQSALANSERDMPGLNIAGDLKADADGKELVAVAGDKDIVTRSDRQTAITDVKFVPGDFFDVTKDAEYVVSSVAKKAGLTTEDLYLLMRPVSTTVQDAVAGGTSVKDYVVIVKKAQVYKEDPTALADYNDSLAGTVFSRETIKDNDGVYYNGTNKAKAN